MNAHRCWKLFEPRTRWPFAKLASDVWAFHVAGNLRGDSQPAKLMANSLAGDPRVGLADDLASGHTQPPCKLL